MNINQAFNWIATKLGQLDHPVPYTLNCLEAIKERMGELEERPSVAVDIIIHRGTGFVGIKRLNDPFKDHYALPGGFVEPGESVEQAAIREAKEETGLDIEIIKMVGVYSEPGRDPRKSVISVCFTARGWGNLQAGDDAKEAEVIDSLCIPRMAFDHNKMLKDAGIGV